VDYIYSEEELRAFFPWYWDVSAPEEYFPMEILEFVYEREPAAGDGDYSVIELEGGLEEALASDAWQTIEEMLGNTGISANSFQILTTNDPVSLFRLNQRRNLFWEGRKFSAREIEDGARVCLVSRQFAEHNGLEVGDTLFLRLYNSVLGMDTATYLTSDGGEYVTRSFWVPSLYRPELEITEPAGYTVIGIYHTLSAEPGDYAITPNTVILPDHSVGTLKGEPVSLYTVPSHTPLLSDAMIIPNGRTEESRIAINGIAEGYGSLFRFYDQGYESLMKILRNLRFGAAWILSLSAAVWAAVAFLFAMFYIARKRKEAFILRAIGVSQRKRFRWVYTQSVILIMVSLGITVSVTLPIYGNIVNNAAAIAQTFTDSFRDLTLSDAAETGIRSTLPLSDSPAAMLVTMAGAAMLMLAVSGWMSARTVRFKSLSEERGEG
jgi:hypothetical protein